MVDRLIFVCAVLALIAFITLVIPVLTKIIWNLRDMQGVGLALAIKILSGDIWMIIFLGSVAINRIWDTGGIPDWILVPLALTLVLRPILFRLWYWRWRRQVLLDMQSIPFRRRVFDD